MLQGKRDSAAAVELSTGRTFTYTLSIPLQLPLCAAILDVGYGSGNWLLTMAELGYRNLSGYDIHADPEVVAKFDQRGIRLLGELGEHCNEDSSYDCIRLEHVFEHLSDPKGVLETCRRILKPGGRLLLNLPCAESWSERVSLVDNPSLELPRHLYRHSQESIRTMLEEAGFRVVGIISYGVVNHVLRCANARLRRRGLRGIPLSLGALLGPAYSAFCHATGKGDHMTIMASIGAGQAAG